MAHIDGDTDGVPAEWEEVPDIAAPRLDAQEDAAPAEPAEEEDAAPAEEEVAAPAEPAEEADAAPAVPAQPVAPIYDEDYINKNIMIAGSVNRIFKIANFTEHNQQEVDQSMFTKLIDERVIVPKDSYNDIGGATIVAIKWRVTFLVTKEEEMHRMFNSITNKVAATLMTSSVGATDVLMLILRKNGRHTPPVLTEDPVNVWIANITGKRERTKDISIDIFLTFAKFNAVYFSDIGFSAVTQRTLETVELEIAKLTANEIRDLHIASKAVPKKARTQRQEILVSVGLDLSRKRKAEELGESSIQIFINTPHYRWNSFIGVDDLVCKTRSEITGALVTYPLKAWVSEGYYDDTTLILHGGSGVGKTSLAKCLCAGLADRLQINPSPYYLKCGTVDAAKDAVFEGVLKTGVPLFCDDLTAGEPRGSRPPHSLDDVVHFCEVEDSSGINARNKDMSIPKGVPRVITSNARSPHEWHPLLPKDAWIISDAAVRACSHLVRGTFKRTVWCLIEEPLVDDVARAGAKMRRRADAASKMAGFFS